MLIVVVKTGTALSAIFDGRNMLQSADGIHAETLPEHPRSRNRPSQPRSVSDARRASRPLSSGGPTCARRFPGASELDSPARPWPP